MEIKKLEHQSGIEQISDMLMLNGTLTDCPGLVHGKMGIAVFFFHYAQYTDNMLFAYYAQDLIGEIQMQIHINSPADYEKGIAGIGVGIDYLTRNKFLNVDDDIFEDFDSRMYRAVMYDPWLDFSLYNGLIGYGKYWIARLLSKQAMECLLCIIQRIEENYSNISTKEQTDIYCFLLDLQGISGFDSSDSLLEQCRRKWDFQMSDINRSFHRLGGSAVSNIIRAYQSSLYFNDSLQVDIDIALKQIPALDMEKAPTGTGLLNGYAGEGMLRLTAIEPSNISWMNLL
jgi:hypothetical protein